MKSKWIAAFVGLGVFVAGAAWWGMSGPRELASIGSGAYAFTYDFSLDLAQAPSGNLTSRVQGTLHLAESDGQMRARLKVEDLQTKAPEGSKLGLLGDNPKQQLQSRFVVVREKDGAIREVLLPEKLSLSVRSILAAAVNNSQYVQAPGAEVKAWASKERNANGSFKAKYTFVDDDNVKKVWKLGTTNGLGGVNGQSKAHFMLEGPRVKNVRVSQQGSALTGNQRSPFSLRLTLERVGDADTRYIEEGDDSGANSSQAGPLLAFTTKTATPKNLKVATHAPRPLGELMTSLSKVTAEDSLKQATALRAELTEAVIRSPEVALALDQLLRLETVVVFQARYAVEALLGARVPHSDLLAAKLIIDKSLSQTSHTMLMAGAALLDSPTPKVVAAVRHVMHTEKDRTKKGRATLALSGLASHIRQSEIFRKQDNGLLGTATLPTGGTTQRPTDVVPVAPTPTPVDAGQPAQGEEGTPQEPPTWEVPTEAEELPGAAELEAEIIEEARFVLEELPSSTFAWKVSVIRALGNLGTEGCMPLVRTALEDENLLVRAAAATALRHQDPANVMEDLQRALNDTELEVRSAAVKAARKMGPAATKELVQSVLFFDKSEYVRLQAVYTFGAWSHEAPAVINTLVQAEEHEKSPKVMQAIRHMRHKNRIEPPFVQNPLPEEDQ